MNKINKTLYSLMFATSSTLLSQNYLYAEDISQWECTPSPDFRSWNCLKDGKPPVEEIPESVSSTDSTPEEPASVTTTPLATPAPIPAEIAEETAPALPAPEPAIAPPPPTVSDDSQALTETATPTEAIVEPSDQAGEEAAKIPQPVSEETGTQEPLAEPAETKLVESRPAKEPEIQPTPEQPIERQPDDELVQLEESSTAAELPPESETKPDVVSTGPADQQPVESALVSDAPLTDRYAPLESPLVTVDENLRSCVAINRPFDAQGQDLNQVRENAPAEIEADEAQIEKDNKTILTGDVVITRADQSLKTQELVLNKATNQADASGKVFYTDNQIQIKAEQAHLDLNRDEHSFAEAGFITLDRYSQGTAGQIQLQQKEKVKLDKVTYTTCPPGSNAWKLEADEITLNQTTGRGEARNAKFEFFDVPVMYLPYMNFPIDDRRQSGVLTPQFGHSDDRGTELTVPIYWNIAPDRDATFYPRYMSKRGLQLGGEYRYLTNTDQVGQINAEYLADDDEYEGRGDNDRWAVKFDHSGSLNLTDNAWSYSAHLARVSDDRYFEDLGKSLAVSSQTHLHSYATLSRSADNWSAYGLLQNFQTVDRTIADIDRPYRRLPELRFNYWTDPFAERFTANLKTSYTQFDHSSNLKLTGDRTELYPSITYNYDTAGYYVRPKLGVHYTNYSLDNEGTLPSSPDRTVPIFSLDSGLFYEKDTTLFGDNYTQTLEPRFFYLNVDEENQNDIPVFDTSELDFNSSSLFSENRFNSIDRIGDANQFSVGVTTRFLDPADGTEKISATVGQIYYFDDRDVTLPGELPDTDDVSPIITELSYRPYRDLIANAQLHWDPEESKTERQIYRIKYQPEDDKILNFAYRFRDGFIKQTDVSALWPLDSRGRWHAVGRWNYSLRDDKTLDTFGGIEYESCCWKTRFVARRWVNDVDSDYDTAVFLELELKGLGSIGDDITSFLETGILGYDRYTDENR